MALGIVFKSWFSPGVIDIHFPLNTRVTSWAPYFSSVVKPGRDGCCHFLRLAPASCSQGLCAPEWELGREGRAKMKFTAQGGASVAQSLVAWFLRVIIGCKYTRASNTQLWRSGGPSQWSCLDSPCRAGEVGIFRHFLGHSQSPPRMTSLWHKAAGCWSSHCSHRISSVLMNKFLLVFCKLLGQSLETINDCCFFLLIFNQFNIFLSKEEFSLSPSSSLSRSPKSCILNSVFAACI